MTLIPEPSTAFYIETGLGPLLTLKFSDSSSFPNKLEFYKKYMRNYINEAFSDEETSDEFHCNHAFNSQWIYFVFDPDTKTLEDVHNGNVKVVSHAAFSLKTYKETSMLYHHVCIVDPQYEGKGIFSKLTGVAMDEVKAEYYCCRTQNPAVVRGLQRTFGVDNVFTEILWKDTERESEVREELEKVKGMATMLSEYLKMEDSYEKDLMIGRGIYLKRLFKMLSKKEYEGFVGERFNQYLDRENGDCLFVFAKLVQKKEQ